MKWLDRSLIVGPHLTLVTSEKQYNKVMTHLRLPRKNWPTYANGGNASTLLLENSDGEQVCVVSLHTVPKGTPKSVVYGLLVHEAVHVFQHKLDGMGEDKPSKEFQAYSIQSIACELFDQYARMK